LLPWLTFKPNRIVKGTPLPMGEVLPPAAVALFLIIVAAALVLSIRRLGGSARPIILGALGALMLLLLFGAGVASQQLEGERVARIALAGGAYLVIFASYLLIITSREDILSGKRWIVEALTWLGPSFVVLLVLTGSLNHLAILREFDTNRRKFFYELGRHLGLTGASVGLGTLIGVPLGVWAYRNRLLEKPIFVFVNTIQTVPSLALFGLMIAPLAWLSFRFPALRAIGIRGIGGAPALIALTLYALLPITRNTYTSLKILPPALLEAGRGMGMSRFQVLRMIEVPLAMPLILSGLRTATVQTIGNTAVAALIGAGGFGIFIFQAIGQAATDLILLGALPVIVLALTFDRIMRAGIDGLTRYASLATEGAGE
jgi:osmoprotectant transport system permease protein